MSTLHVSPAIERIHPPPPSDRLGGAVLQSLVRRRGEEQSWGVLRTLLASVLTLGLLPVIVWPIRFRNLVIMEQQQYWHAAEWLRLRTGRPEAQSLLALADRMRFRWELWVLSLICLGWVIFHFAAQMQWGLTVRELIGTTYGFGRGRYGALGLPYLAAERVFLVWTVALCLAYASHWVQVQWRAWDVSRFVMQYNRLAIQEGLPQVQAPPIELGLRPLWMLGAVVLALLGALWGIPMMLAGAVHRHYARSGPRVRQGMAEGVKWLLVNRRPAAEVVVPPRLLERCRTPKCACRLPDGARFCPRCGAPSGG